MAFPPMDASFLVDGMTGLPTPPVAPVAPVAPPMAAPVLDDPMDPSALGLSPVGPAPERPTLGGQKPDSLAQIVRLAMLGLAAGMGPGRGTGLAQGMVLADQRRQQQQLQQDRIALQDYQIARSDWEQQQRQAAQEADRRGRVLMSALSNLERDLDATKSSADAERVYQMYGAALSAQGYRGYDPESLKRKFKNPDRKARAMKVVDAYMKNPVWVKVYESDPDAALEATVDLDGVGVTMREAMQIAGSGLIGKDGKAIVPRTPPKADTRSLDVQAADALRRGDTAEYERLKRVKREMGEEGRAPRSGEAALMQVTEIDPDTGEVVTRLVPKQAGEVSRKPAKEPTQGQYAAGGYATRVEQAESILAQLEPSISGMSQISFSAQMNAPSAKLRSGNIQSYDQAARNFINAVLRRESGAAISPMEFDNARQQYLPVPGDTARTLEQKRLNRQAVINALRREAGRAYQPPPTAAGATVGGRSVTVGGQSFGVQVIP